MPIGFWFALLFAALFFVTALSHKNDKLGRGIFFGLALLTMVIGLLFVFYPEFFVWLQELLEPPV